MPNLVTLQKLNALRFPLDPVPLTMLQRWARTDKLRGARKIGGVWYVDLEKFDGSESEKQQEKPPVQAIVSRVLDRMRQERPN